MERGWKPWLPGLVPAVLYSVGIALPAVNGPHAWLGLPSLVWRLCLSAVSMSAAVAFFEKTRGGERE